MNAARLYYAIGLSALGKVLVACNETGLCALYLDDQEETLVSALQQHFPKAALIEDKNRCAIYLAQSLQRIENPKAPIQFDLAIQGTAFQQQVWQVLSEIPLGTTVTYHDVAEKIKNPKAVRAVANACGANKISVIIPCHRVIRKSGALGGYRWGLARKKALLGVELLKNTEASRPQ